MAGTTCGGGKSNGVTLTTGDIARRYRIKHEKVQKWIESGALRGFNVANSDSKMPRYRVYLEDLEAFEASRTPQARQKKAVRRKRRVPSDVVEFL